MNIIVVEGDLLDQDVDVIVNAWNRNIIPWWLLLPQGDSGAIKKRGVVGPFRELRTCGAIPLGGAALTWAGRLPFKAIIQFRSIGFPLIGAGSGGFDQEKAKAIMLHELQDLQTSLAVTVVEFRKQP